MHSVLWPKVKAWWASLKATTEEPVDVSTLPLIEQCRHVYKHLDLSALVDWRQTYGHRRTIKVIHKNVDACILDITAHAENIERSGHVLDSQCRHYSLIEKPFNQFMLTAGGFYQASNAQRLEDLREAVLALCDTVDEAGKTDFPTRSYNLRMLNSLFFVLIDMGGVFEELNLSIANQP